MRLSLSLPESFRREELDLHHLRAVLTTDASPLVLEATLCLGAPVDVESWMRDALLANLPEKRTPIFSEVELQTTQSGWPVRIVSAELHADDEITGDEDEYGPIVEYRLGGFYVFLSYAAQVIIYCDSLEAYEEQKKALYRILLAATVEWPDGTAATLAGLCS